MDILLGADMIHLFPKLDYTVEKLGLYMSFLTKRYIMMGQLQTMHRRSSWQSSDGSLRSTVAEDYTSSTCLGLDTRLHNHQGDKPPQGPHLEALTEEELQTPTQRCRGQRWSQKSQHDLSPQYRSGLRHHLRMCLWCP